MRRPGKQAAIDGAWAAKERQNSAQNEGCGSALPQSDVLNAFRQIVVEARHYAASGSLWVPVSQEGLIIRTRCRSGRRLCRGHADHSA
jgi:hypothetical protein